MYKDFESGPHPGISKLKGSESRPKARENVLRIPAANRNSYMLGLDRNLDKVHKSLNTRTRSRNSLTWNSAPSGGLAATETVTDATLHAEVTNSSLCTQPSRSELIMFRPNLDYFGLNHRSDCSRGTCVCICHHTTRDIYHRSRIKGSSWTSLFVKCSCNTKAFSWVITAFQRQISLTVSLAYEQGFSLSPSFRICNTVPNTSPLFVVLYKCKIGYMQFDKALSDIRAIISSGGGSPYDMNRDGDNWFEVCKLH